MSQSSLDDDELFGEAAAEMREDVEDHLASARDALPEGDAIWDAEADNTLGVLNGLKSALAAEEVDEHLRSAKKWYTIGERADAFDDASDLEAEIEEIEAILDDLQAVSRHVTELTGTLPELRSKLDDLHADDEDDE